MQLGAPDLSHTAQTLNLDPCIQRGQSDTHVGWVRRDTVVGGPKDRVDVIETCQGIAT